METDQFPELTEKCENFKNHLETVYGVPQYGNFIGAYRFPLAAVNELINRATSQGATPAFLKAYYGCNAQGEDHRLYLAVLDNAENVLQVQAVETSAPEASFKMLEAAAGSDRCPPGCFTDPVIGRLLG